MLIDSDNTQPPDFGPTVPIYPELPQIIRAAKAALPGTNVYPAFVTQYNPLPPLGPLTFRDREDCYLTEPNGAALGPALYDARLVGNYLGLPLFATVCCPNLGFASASSSSSR